MIGVAKYDDIDYPGEHVFEVDYGKHEVSFFTKVPDFPTEPVNLQYDQVFKLYEDLAEWLAEKGRRDSE